MASAMTSPSPPRRPRHLTLTSRNLAASGPARHGCSRARGHTPTRVHQWSWTATSCLERSGSCLGKTKPTGPRLRVSARLGGPLRLLVAGLIAALATHDRGRRPNADRERVRPSSLPRQTPMSQPGTPWGRRAFTAAALSPAEGHVLFGYAGIAVYDAVMAVRHEYEPFAIRSSAPSGASPEAAVVAAAHRIYEQYLPTPGGHDPRPGVRRIPGNHPRRAGKARRGRRRDSGRQRLHRPGAPTTASAKTAVYTPPDPAVPGETRSQPPPRLPSGHTSGACRPFGLESADQFRPDGPPSTWEQAMGSRLQRGQGDRLA